VRLPTIPATENAVRTGRRIHREDYRAPRTPPVASADGADRAEVAEVAEAGAVDGAAVGTGRRVVSPDASVRGVAVEGEPVEGERVEGERVEPPGAVGVGDADGVGTAEGAAGGVGLLAGGGARGGAGDVGVVDAVRWRGRAIRAATAQVTPTPAAVRSRRRRLAARRIAS
jgi:hypothetical protein